MTTLSKVRCCARLPSNTGGRTLVVGDLHGHRGLLERELERIAFDTRRDRVLSVGDLVDRGPDSLGTLALLEEPWFHAVMGNHELMLLNYLGYYSSRMHCRKAYAEGGGAWVHEAVGSHRKLVSRLADLMACLPLALQVDDEVPFSVMHAGQLASAPLARRLLERDTLSVHKADSVTSSRAFGAEAMAMDPVTLQFAGRRVSVSNTPLSDLRLTYVGHSPVRDITIHNSYVCIDQGVRMRPGKPSAAVAPTVINHGQFASWLDGVTSARLPERLAA